MYPNVPKCILMYPSVSWCTQIILILMYPSVPKCILMYPNVAKCILCVLMHPVCILHPVPDVP